jgi:hypothetical protein
MKLPRHAPDSIWKITSAREVLCGIRPLLSNAEPKRSDLTLERYKTGTELRTPPVRFENQHLVGISWTGLFKETGGSFRSMSIPNATSIFPLGLTLHERHYVGCGFYQSLAESAVSPASRLENGSPGSV